MLTYDKVQGWFDWKPLADRIARNQLPDGGIYVEVGVWKGKSMIHFCHEAKAAGKSIEAYGIDLFGGKQDDSCMDQMVEASGGDFFGETYQNIVDAGLVDDVNLIRDDSTRYAEHVQDDVVDVLLIDALHTYEAVKKDTLAWLPKVKRGGWIMWHDADRECVRRAIAECIGPNFKIEPPRTAFWRKS